jgi:hypothetical protein
MIPALSSPALYRAAAGTGYPAAIAPAALRRPMFSHPELCPSRTGTLPALFPSPALAAPLSPPLEPELFGVIRGCSGFKPNLTRLFRFTAL